MYRWNTQAKQLLGKAVKQQKQKIIPKQRYSIVLYYLIWPEQYPHAAEKQEAVACEPAETEWSLLKKEEK